MATHRRGDSISSSAARPRPVVLKFGGTSVGDAGALERVAVIVPAHGGPQPVVVVSAMSRVTDALVAAAWTASGAGLDDQLGRHRAAARQLLPPPAAAAFEAVLARARETLAALLRVRPVSHDEVVAFGEDLSATLVTAVLAARCAPSSTDRSGLGCACSSPAAQRARARRSATQSSFR